jgi:hypothetical protein
MQRRHGVMYSVGGTKRAGFTEKGDPAIQGTPKYTEGLLEGKTETENCSYNGGLPWSFRARDVWDQQITTIDKVARGEAPGIQDLIAEFRRLTEPILARERTTPQQLQK